MDVGEFDDNISFIFCVGSIISCRDIGGCGCWSSQTKLFDNPGDEIVDFIRLVNW